jgi:hypothetical protein
MTKKTITIPYKYVVCAECKEKIRDKELLEKPIEIEVKVISDIWWVLCPICKCWKIISSQGKNSSLS